MQNSNAGRHQALAGRWFPVVILASSILLPLTSCASRPASVEVAPVRADKNEPPEPYSKLDDLRTRFSSLSWKPQEESATLATDFAAIRSTVGWKAFVNALKICDDSVNTLLEEDITDWRNPASKIDVINKTRNAWRRATTYGIKPPKLPMGWTSFVEADLSFTLRVGSSGWQSDYGNEGTLIVRSQRGQVLGIFTLRLDDGGRQHIVTHMLEAALRSPDLYLSYPWDVIMATDTIVVPDIRVFVDRLKKTAKVVDTGSGETETKK